MKTASLALLLILALASGAQADTITRWDVSYFTRGDISQVTHWYGVGTYQFLLAPSYITVYVLEATSTSTKWVWLGHYGEIALPDTLPPIVFPEGTNGAGAVSRLVDITPTPDPVAVPEPPAWLLAFTGLIVVAGYWHGRCRRI